MRSTQRDGLAWCGKICALILTLALPAFAGDDPAASPPAAAPVNVPQSQRVPPIPLGMVMQQNGGSLLRAEVEYRAVLDPNLGTKQDAEADHDAPPGSFRAVNFFSVPDPKAKSFKKHDLITIVAKENSTFKINGNEALTKSQDFDSQLNAFVAVHPSTMQLNSIISGGSNFPEIKTTNTRDYTGTGEVDRTDTFSDRVTAEVVDVKPNGTLVLQAIKEIRTDEEDQRMILTGICRAEDVTADNTVLTQQLFDLELTQTHTGSVNDTTRRGLLPRLLDTFSPF